MTNFVPDTEPASRTEGIHPADVAAKVDTRPVDGNAGSSRPTPSTWTTRPGVRIYQTRVDEAIAILRKLVQEVIPMSKKEEIECQRELISHLLEKYPDNRGKQLAEWPHSKSLFYQRKKEVPRSRSR